MTTWPPDEARLIRRSVQTRPLRNRTTHAAARAILRRFQPVVQTHGPHQPLAQATGDAGVHDGAGRGSRRRVIDSTRRGDGFLTWRVAHGVLAVHPWATRRPTDGGRMAPIGGAVLAPNPSAALDARRPLPRLGRHLGSARRPHLAPRRRLGCRDAREPWRWLPFDRDLPTRPDADQRPVHRLGRE
jgi:hypothetical protein